MTGANVIQNQQMVPLYTSSLNQVSLKFAGAGNGQTYCLAGAEFGLPVELNLGSAIDNVQLTDYGFITSSF